MSQTIDLNITEAMTFNGSDVEVLQLNGETIWEKLVEKDLLIQYLTGSLKTLSTEDLEGVLTIRPYAFSERHTLEEVALPELDSLGHHVFHNCTGLKSVTFTNSTLHLLSTIPNYAFSGCTSLTEITLPQTVTSLGDYAFQGCTSLTKVTFNLNTLEYFASMPQHVFADCTRLSEITIPNGTTNIKDSAFLNCTSLTEVIIPPAVLNIETNAFARCTGLHTLKVLPTTPPTLHSTALPTTITRLEVPADSLDAYQTAANWGNFASIMVGV